jgi:hypothetical protein
MTTTADEIIAEAEDINTALRAWVASGVLFGHVLQSDRRISYLLLNGYGVRSRKLYRAFKRRASQQRRLDVLHRAAHAVIGKLKVTGNVSTQEIAS